MPSYIFPKKNTEFVFYIGLVQQADTKLFQSNPTIAAGDFKVSTDGGALANPATLPAVTPGSSKLVKVTLSASEMNGDNVMLIGSDAAGAEWCDIIVNIQTALRQADDLAYPATSGRSLLVAATGSVPATSLETQAKADVNAEVVDVLNVDTFAEPSGVPAATTTLVGKLGRLYAALTNRVVVTATKKQFANASNVDQWEKDLSDNGTTYTESAGNAP